MALVSWIGVDIAKHNLVAAKRQGHSFRVKSFPLDGQGLRAFSKWLPKKKNIQVVFEATGPYWRPLSAYLESRPRPIPYAVVNPRRLRHFAKASAEASKTDVLDAQILILFAETFQPATSTPCQPCYHELRALVRHYLQLRGELDRARDRAEKASADPHTPPVILLSLAQLQDHLQQALTAILKQARQLVLQEGSLRRIFRLLLSIPGVGEKTALTLISEYGPGLTQAGPRQLTSYAGLNVVLWESGTSVRKLPRISKQGNWRIRRILYLAALVAVRHNPVLKHFYQRRLDKGCCPKSALVAAMRKLLHICWGVLKNQSPFDNEHAFTAQTT